MKKPNYVTLEDYLKRFSKKQRQNIEAEIRLYDLVKSVRQARKQKGLTQAELAKKAGINRTTLSLVETGSRNVTVATLMRLADAMDMKLDIRLTS